MGAAAADIGLTIHPHPTLSETFGMAAEAFEGTITDLYIPKKKYHGEGFSSLGATATFRAPGPGVNRLPRVTLHRSAYQ